MKDFVTKVFGFNVRVKNPKRIIFEGEEIADIDYEELGYEVMAKLLASRRKFTGAHIKFFRHQLELTQFEVATALGKEQGNISRIENKGSQVAFDTYADNEIFRLYFTHSFIQKLTELHLSIPPQIEQIREISQFYQPASRAEDPEVTVVLNLDEETSFA